MYQDVFPSQLIQFKFKANIMMYPITELSNLALEIPRIRKISKNEVVYLS